MACAILKVQTSNRKGKKAMTRNSTYKLNDKLPYDVRGKEVKNNTLLNLTWSDGDMQSGAGTRYNIFTPEQRSKLTFHNHKWLGGEVVVSYDGEIIYITNNGLKTNHTTAMNIKDAIKTGYTQNIALLED